MSLAELMNHSEPTLDIHVIKYIVFALKSETLLNPDDCLSFQTLKKWQFDDFSCSDKAGLSVRLQH